MKDVGGCIVNILLRTVQARRVSQMNFIALYRPVTGVGRGATESGPDTIYCVGEGFIMAVNNIDLSRILSLIISVLTDPYDKFIEKLHADGRITDEEVIQLRQALKDQIPRLSELVRPQASEGDT